MHTLPENFVQGLVILVLVFFVAVSNEQQMETETVNFLTRKDIIITKFIYQLVNEQFSNCSLLVLRDNLEDGNKASVTIKHVSSAAKYLVSFLNITQSSIVYNSLSHSRTQPVTFTTRLSDSRRYDKHCTVTIAFVNHANSGFWNQVRNVISPPYLPITRKDMDHYIFVAEAHVHSKLLHLKGFINKIKFKIAVGVGKSNRLQVTTVDFFGGLNGSPQVVHLPTDNIMYQKEIDFFPDFVWNLRGYTMQVVIPFARALVEANAAPWTDLNNAKRGPWKYLFEDFLMTKMNFTYRMFPSTGKDGKIGAGGTGVQLPNGTWIGLTGDLYYGRADIGLAAANTDKRTQYIGFTDTYFDMGCLIFVTGHPSQVYSSLTLARPLDRTVWMSIIFSIFGALIITFFATKLLQTLHLEQASITVRVQLILILAPFVEQDSPFLPFSNPLRIFIAFWSFFTLITLNSYRSRLVSLLAFPLLGEVPQTFRQLAFSDFNVGFMKNGDSAYNTFSKSKDTVYVELLNKMEILKGVNVECLEKVVSHEKYGCIAYDFDVMYLIQKNFSDVKARKVKFSNARTYNVWLGIATEAQSIYRVNLGKILGRTLPFHLGQVWENMDMYENVRKPKLKWWKDTNQTQELSQVEQKLSVINLELKNIQGVFYIYFYCVISSLFLFLIENCTSKEKVVKAISLFHQINLTSFMLRAYLQKINRIFVVHQ